jgi:hypothetical protein
MCLRDERLRFAGGREVDGQLVSHVPANDVARSRTCHIVVDAAQNSELCCCGADR